MANDPVPGQALRVSPGDFQSCNVIAEIVDANLKTLVDRAAMRRSVVEAGAQNEVRILETLAAYNKPLHLVSAVGHRMKIGDNALGDFAATFAESGSQSFIVL